MPSLRVISESGEVVEQEVANQQASIVVDGEEFSPTVVERIEYDSEGKMSQITTVCGETENRRESSKGPDITVEGVVTKDELEPLKNLERGVEITMVSDIDTNVVEIKRITIEQRNDLVEIVPDGSSEPQLAFGFQLQLKHPES